MTTTRILASALMAALLMGAAGCTVASSDSSGVPGEEMTSAVLSDGQVRSLGLEGVGRGEVTWWMRTGDLHYTEPVGVVSGFAPPGFGADEIFVPQVSPERPDRQHVEVVVRPAWSSRIDNTSDVVHQGAFVEEVTVSFANPGSPGQHQDDSFPRVTYEGEVQVAAGTCEDLVGLQVWQMGPPPQGSPETIAAQFLGSVLVRMPCV